jgi:hypothetical protein
MNYLAEKLLQFGVGLHIWVTGLRKAVGKVHEMVQHASAFIDMLKLIN